MEYNTVAEWVDPIAEAFVGFDDLEDEHNNEDDDEEYSFELIYEPNE